MSKYYKHEIMGNIFTSSIGRKLIMSITGAFLLLFLTFHLVMNAVLIFSESAYNAICAFLGANWYAVIGTAVLAAGVGLHFLYAGILTVRNARARGNVRYAVSKKEHGVSWASKNMFILGGVVFLGLLLHLYNFWYNMQLVELMGEHANSFGHNPADGAWLVKHTFSNIWYVVIYLAWFAALWLHLTHGIWSMLQSAGMNSKVWMRRLKIASYAVATMIMGGYAIVVIVLHLQGIML